MRSVGDLGSLVSGVAAALVLASCGARTPLREPPVARDGGRLPDAGVVDVRDAGSDSGLPLRRDAGPDVMPVRCARDRDCSVGVCTADRGAAAIDLAPLALLCAPRGPVGPPHTGCDDGTACDHGVCLTAGSCVAPCVADDDCAGPSERCAPVFARTGPGSLQPVSACVRRTELDAATDVDSRVVSGVFTGAGDDRVPLEPYPGDATWVIEGPPDIQLSATHLESRDPTPRIVWDLLSLAPGAPTQDNPVTYGVWPAVVRVPIGSTPLASATGWTVGIESTGGGDARVTRIARAGSGRVLDLHVFYAGVPDSPRGARGPAWLTRALDTAARYLAPLGVTIGDLTQDRIVGSLGEQFAIIEEDAATYIYPDLGPMLELSADARGPGVNLFFVRYIDMAQGISAGIPGPPAMHGTTASGVAIAVEEILMDPEIIGLVVAHEVSHYLGLCHTTEADGTVIDPLSDTGECRPDRDVDRDGYVTYSECIGAGADNLMFWAATGIAVTPEQRRVVGGALMLR